MSATAITQAALAFGRVRCSRCERRLVARRRGLTSPRATRAALARRCPHCGGEHVLDVDYFRGR